MTNAQITRKVGTNMSRVAQENIDDFFIFLNWSLKVTQNNRVTREEDDTALHWQPRKETIRKDCFNYD